MIFRSKQHVINSKQKRIRQIDDKIKSLLREKTTLIQEIYALKNERK